MIEIPAQENDFVIAVATVKAVAQRRDQCLRASGKRRQSVRDDLETVIATFTEQEVFRLMIQAVGSHVKSLKRLSQGPLNIDQIELGTCPY